MKKQVIDNVPCSECTTNGNSIFCNISSGEKDAISERKGMNFFKKGQVIFYEGNHSHGLFCIKEGKVKISKLGDEGKEQVVRFATSGELIGYRAMLSNESYNATATALEDCHVCQLSKGKIFDLLQSNQNFSLQLLKVLSDDLKKSEQKLINIAQKSVRERIAESILILKEKFGLKEDGKTLSVVLTRKELGDVAGITTETTIRTLSDFNKEGIIDLEGKYIRIANLKKLIQTANLLD